MKKILSALLAVLMLAGALTVGMSAQEFLNDDTYKLGNADGSADNKINGQDLYMMCSYLAGGTYAIDNLDRNAADLNADGKINATDIYYLKRIAVGSLSASDLENGFQVYRFAIGGTDISEFDISLPDYTSEETNGVLTAEILRDYIKQATGVELPIVRSASTREHSIVIHEVDRWSELGERLQNENYMYKVADGKLELYGTYRGNMYAAYEIIEDYLGFRFFDGTYTYLYKSRYVDIPDGTDVFFEPYLKFRHTGQNVGALDTYYLPSRMNGTRSDPATSDLRHGTFYGHQFCNAHSYGLYWRMATGTRPADDDPNYPTEASRYNQQYESGYQQDELSWQPCATRDDIYNTLFSGLIDTVKRMESWEGFAWYYDFKDENGEPTDYVKSGQASMSFSLCDNEHYCPCRYCNLKANGKLDKKTGEWVTPPEGYSGVYVDLANRAARDIQEYYPGIRIHTILYNHDIPATVRPDKNLIVYYCGQGCNNHVLGSDECGTCLGQLGKENNVFTNKSLKAWGDMCRETGAEMWYWYYGVTYHYYLVGLPCVFNLYYDYQYLYNVGVRGINYEGGGRNYNFGTLKAYLSTRLQWNPTMTYDEYIGYMKEYLYMYYGDGYEEIYEFIEMENTAGDECGTCFISNFDRPGDMYSYEYIAEHYEYMRELLVSALEKADRPERIKRIETLICCFDFLGLSSSYDDMYVNGDAESRALYEERYTDFYNYIVDNNMAIFSDPVTYTVPKTCDFTVNPMTQFYEHGSRRPDVTP